MAQLRPGPVGDRRSHPRRILFDQTAGDGDLTLTRQHRSIRQGLQIGAGTAQARDGLRCLPELICR